MNARERALQWATGLEAEQDGVARTVDVNHVEVEVDIDDVDKNDIKDADTETENVKDGGDDVSVKTGDVSKEDFDATTSSQEDGAKTIDATFIEPVTGCNKRFVITGFDATNNPAKEPGDNLTQCVILLQCGTIPEVGLNGVTAEDLMKVVREVFVEYQESKFACEENAEALTHIEAALAAMSRRTNRRKDEGVEGTHEGN